LGVNPANFDPANDPTSPQGSSIQGTTGGNRNLREETAKTWTAGLVLRPRFLPGLNIAADWYDIKIKDAVSTPTATELATLCYDQPTLDNVYCNALSRSASTGYINNFRVGPENVANFDTEGLDLTLNYRFRPSARLGSFNFRVNGNYTHKLEFIPTPGAEVDDDLGESNRPKYSATADLTWTKGPLTVNYGVNWFSRTWRVISGLPVSDSLEANPDIVDPKYRKYKEYWNHQAQVSYDVDRRLNVYVGADNLLDTKPDVAASGYPISAVGRYFYVGARAKF
jgi:outer membrane receptor protein involved in Fe transport